MADGTRQSNESVCLVMRTENQIEAAAAAAAEKANGGKFSDPLFYKPEHQAFGREVVRAGLDAADALQKPKARDIKSFGEAEATERVSQEELAEFSGHCVYIRSVYQFAMRIWRDSDDGERNLMESVAPLFFEDIGKVLTEFLVTAACRITDPAIDDRGNENFTVELFLKNFKNDTETYQQLDQSSAHGFAARQNLASSKQTRRACRSRGHPEG
jgi:hypothetical protein